MLKCEVAAILMLPAHDKLTYVLGSREGFATRPLPPFASEVRDFLACLSARLMANATAKTLPDAIAFAWWCRKANVERLAAAYGDGACRLGRGLAFHVAPSNTPVNFAFSWVFALLAGNANIVRLPGRDFPQIPLILGCIAEVLESGPFSNIRAMNAFVSYGREEEINRGFSVIADVRILWGGDRTIEEIRRVAPLAAHAIDIGFADRYSLCLLGADKILALDSAGIERLASGFFNDAYLMDQNACSSPRLVLWLGNENQTAHAMERFWAAIQNETASRYTLPPILAVDKLTQVCRDAVDLECATALARDSNRVYRVRLNALDPDIMDRRCAGGYFYEYRAASLAELAPIITRRCQTLTYFGASIESLRSFVLENRLKGIDRIVPVGEAMNIGLLWDGYDLIRTLSRVCDVH